MAKEDKTESEIQPIPDTPEERRTMLDEMAARHDTLNETEMRVHDMLAHQVAFDEDAVQNEIGKDPDVNPPEVVTPDPPPMKMPEPAEQIPPPEPMEIPEDA